MRSANLRMYREELGRFDRRWPGLKNFPAEPNVAHGKDLDLTHVGPKVPLRVYNGPKAVTLTPEGGWLDTYNFGSKLVVGQHFDGCTFTIPSAYPNIGITFAHCKFTGTPADLRRYIASATGFLGGGVTLINCHFDGAGWVATSSGRSATDFPGMTARWCLFERFDRLLRVTANTTIEGVYARYIAEDQWPGDHVSLMGAQLNPITNAVIRKSRLMARRESDPSSSINISAAITHYNDQVVMPGPFTIEDNYIAGGGQYALYGGGQNDTLPHSKNLTVQRNVFGRDFARFCGDGAPSALVTQSPTMIWANNTWGAPGQFYVAGDPAEGALVLPAHASAGIPNLA